MHRKSNTAPFLWGAVKYDFARDSKKFIILPVEIINLVHIDPFNDLIIIYAPAGSHGSDKSKKANIIFYLCSWKGIWTFRLLFMVPALLPGKHDDPNHSKD